MRRKKGNIFTNLPTIQLPVWTPVYFRCMFDAPAGITQQEKGNRSYTLVCEKTENTEREREDGSIKVFKEERRCGTTPCVFLLYHIFSFPKKLVPVVHDGVEP